MKILIISSCPSNPVTAGNRKFINAQVRLLENLGHEIYFYYIKEFVYGKTNDSEMESLRKRWGDRLFVYNIGTFQKILRVILVRYRWLFCNSYYGCDDYYPIGLKRKVVALNSMFHFGACIINYYNLSKVFVDLPIKRKGIVTHDYFAYKNLLIGEKRIYLNTTAHEEAKALQRCPTIFALNEEEANYFQRLSPLSEVRNIYSYFEFTKLPITGNHNILFLSGANEYNVNGINKFMKEVFPLILKNYPDAHLIIGGGICKRLHSKIPKSVVLYGYVEDIAAFFSQGDIAINPTYQGTGLKIKTFESVSYGKATIVHSHSSIGIYKKETAPIFVAHNKEEWLSYFDYLWNDVENIKKNQDSCAMYIMDMQKYIKEQLEEFLE